MISLRKCFAPKFVLAIAGMLAVLGVSAFAQQVAGPAFTPQGGISGAKFEVVVTCSTPNTTIHFTTNGSDPTLADPVVASGSTVSVAQSFTLKAKAWDNGGTLSPSNVTAASYQVTGIVDGGGIHALALNFDRKLYSWGRQDTGRLGNGVTSTNPVDPPTRVTKTGGSNFDDAIDLSAGTNHSLVVDASGGAWAFGENAEYQLGVYNTTADQNRAVRVWKDTVGNLLGGIVGVSAGSSFSLALSKSDGSATNGQVWSWGSGANGRLGNASTTGNRRYAQAVQQQTTGSPDLKDCIQVSAGAKFGLALDSSGHIWSWGDNDSGQLGTGDAVQRARAWYVEKDSSEAAFDGVVEIAAGWFHSMAVRTVAGGDNRKVYCWGDPRNGRLGLSDGSTTQTTPLIRYPSPVYKSAGAHLDRVVQIAAGPRHSMALDEDGKVWAWGYNQDGNIGNNSTTAVGYATQISIPGNEVIVAIGAGGREVYDGTTGAVTAINSFSYAIGVSGTLYSWGFNGNHELADGTTNQRTTATPAWSGTKLLNLPPTSVTLNVSPASAAALANFAISATPTDPDGTIARVDFYENGAFIGSANSSPWQISRSNVAPNTYAYKARAVDAGGGTVDSSAIMRTVTDPVMTVVATANATEGSATPGRFTVQRSGGSGDLLVSYYVSGGTAVAGADYSLLSGTVTIPNGSLSATIDVAALDDILSQEGTESVIVTLEAGEGYSVGIPTSATLSIIDNPTILTVTPTNAREDGVTPVPGSFKITRTGPTQFPVDVYYSLLGTATLNVDYTKNINTGSHVSFGAGQTEITMTITPLIDSLAEGDESVAFYILDQPFYTGGGTQVSLTIFDAPPIEAPEIWPPSTPAVVEQAWITGLTGATARYTLDGSSPGPSSPSVTAPRLVRIDSAGTQNPAMTLKVRLYAPDRTPSPIVSATYGEMRVEAGAERSFLMNNAGDLLAVGSNANGKLGLGDYDERQMFTPVSGQTNLRSVVAGDDHTLSLTKSGQIYAWGRNASGELGIGTFSSNSNIPVPVNLLGVARVAAGTDFSAAILNNGALYTWGSNSEGKLGINSFDDKESPQPVTSLPNVARVALGAFHAVAVTTSGAVYTWGANDVGQLGNGTTSATPTKIPTLVSGLTNIVAVAAGGAHSMALKADGTVYVWGDNYYGQVTGDVLNGISEDVAAVVNGVSFANKRKIHTPVPVANVSPAIGIAAGYWNTFITRYDGALFAFGYNSNGESGGAGTLGTPIHLVEELERNVAAVTGEFHSLTITGDGTAWSWGRNNEYQLGDSTTFSRNRPFPIEGFEVDSDGDEFNDHYEFMHGSISYLPDSNGDGILDGDAYLLGGDFLLLSEDVDGDGVYNWDEYSAGSSPFFSDTDGDGVGDYDDAFPADPSRWEPQETNEDTDPIVITITSPASGITPVSP